MKSSDYMTLYKPNSEPRKLS